MWEGFFCRCGAVDCRGQLRWDDFKRPEVQAKYATHFLKHVQDKIDAHNASTTSTA
jgi:hypothetical protein